MSEPALVPPPPPTLLPRLWPCRPHLQSVLSSRAPKATGMMLRVLLGAVLPAVLLAAPPPINKLALFPDKSAWCEAKNITQIVGHSGCEAKSIQNRACLGQCFSYSVPNTFPQSTESLVHCDSCMPAQSMWEIVSTAARLCPALAPSALRGPAVGRVQGLCWGNRHGPRRLIAQDSNGFDGSSLTPTRTGQEFFLKFCPDVGHMLRSMGGFPLL